MSSQMDPLFAAMDPVLRAARFAAAKHRDQRRKNGDIPYINHPIRVASTLWVDGEVRDGTTLAAALLHDTIEDTDTTREELEQEFGAEITSVVLEVTDDKSQSKTDRKRAQIAHGPHVTVAARHVKLADKIDNLRDLADRPPRNWTPERVQGYFCWSHDVVDSLRREGCPLCSILDSLFATLLTVDGRRVRAVPEDPSERERLLRAYYASFSANA